MKFDKDQLPIADAIVKSEAKKLIGKYALKKGTDDTYLINDIFRLDNVRPLNNDQEDIGLIIGDTEIIDCTIMVQLDNENNFVELQDFQTEYELEP
ncbi:MAG: hypothetical protein V4506_03560 [Bacteroidota bacterium]